MDVVGFVPLPDHLLRYEVIPSRAGMGAGDIILLFFFKVVVFFRMKSCLMPRVAA